MDEIKKQGFLSRWSRLKRESETIAAEAPPLKPVASPAQVPVADVGAAPEPVELPPIESITLDSDLTPFFRPGVDAQLRRLALRKLFQEPHFNVMDGLDVYIDDYNKSDPLPESMLKELRFARDHLFSEPEKTAQDESRNREALSAESAGEENAADLPGPNESRSEIADVTHRDQMSQEVRSDFASDDDRGKAS
jgi:hypothetical protein